MGENVAFENVFMLGVNLRLQPIGKRGARSS